MLASESQLDSSHFQLIGSSPPLGAPIHTLTAVLLVGRAFVIALAAFLLVAHCWLVAAVGFGA